MGQQRSTSGSSGSTAVLLQADLEGCGLLWTCTTLSNASLGCLSSMRSFLTSLGKIFKSEKEALSTLLSDFSYCPQASATSVSQTAWKDYRSIELSLAFQELPQPVLTLSLLRSLFLSLLSSPEPMIILPTAKNQYFQQLRFVALV